MAKPIKKVKKTKEVPMGVIECPNCGKPIHVNETMQHQLLEKAKGELDEQFKAKETELEKQKKDLEMQKKNADELVNKKIEQERVKLEKEAMKKVEESKSLEIKDLETQLKTKNKKLEEAERQELKLREEKRELEERKKSFELELARKLDQEREKIKEDAEKNVLAEHHFKDAEKDKKLNDGLKQIEELKRKLQQGSQQTQGEVVELELEEKLETQFPLDKIEPVPKGKKGADVIQKIYNKNGDFCGIIIWESKNQKKLSESWIQKLKDDQREASADIAVLISTFLPKGTSNLEFRNGIWIADYYSAIGLATALRNGIIQIAATKAFAEGKNEKMEIIYKYLSSPEFRHKIESIVESFKEMKDDVNEEKRTFAKRIAKKEKQIEKALYATAGMYGDMQGLIGPSMKPIPLLEYDENTVKNTPDKQKVKK